MSHTVLEPGPDDYSLPNNNWTKAKEDKLLEWQQQSRLHSLGHGRAQEIYTKKYDRIQIPSIIMGAVAVFMDGVALILQGQHVPFIITALLLTAIATILNSILQTTKPVEEASEHESMAQGYNKIILQIDSMLAKEYCERHNGSSFLTKIEEELIALKTGGAKIPAFVWTTVKNDFTAGECDFQKLDDEAGFGWRPFHRTIKKHKPSQLDICEPQKEAEIAAVVPDGSGSVVIDVQDNIPEKQPDDELPRFELKIDNDPKTQRLETILWDYQMSRFG